MRKIYIKPHKTERGWWYFAYGDWQPFKRFGHSGWICLRFSFFRRFWNYDGPRPETYREAN